MLRCESVAGADFKVTLEPDRPIIILESNRHDYFPRHVSRRMGGSSKVVVRQALFQIACKAHIAPVGVGYAPEKVDILHGHHPLLKRMMPQPAKVVPYFARAPYENLRSLELRRVILRFRWLSAFAEATVDSPSSEKTQDGLPSVAPNLGSTVAVRSEGWWRRSQRIRTEGEVPFVAPLYFQTEPPIYQKIADKAMHLSQLGMNSNRIAVHLNVDRKHIERALRWITGKQIY